MGYLVTGIIPVVQTTVFALHALHAAKHVHNAYLYKIYVHDGNGA